MIAPRYSAANNNDVSTIRTNTATGSGSAVEKRGIILITPMDAQAARREARKYFHTAESTGVMPRWMGLPAYQNAGNIRIQKDAVQAMAIPTGPHGSARKNKSPVTTNSTTPQRNQRPTVPMETWSQPWVS